jgi:hypothetical protein
MIPENSVYEKTYRHYIARIAGIDLESIDRKLGVEVEGNEIIIPLFGKSYRASGSGITDPSGKRPSLDICVICCKYLLMCPDVYPVKKEWVSYRGLKDSGPLTVYFANDVERAISGLFSGRIENLRQAGENLRGYPPDIEVSYDLSMQFDALPKVPVILLFNDKDDEFPAKSSVLFERRAEDYLDPECLAMVGRLLFTYLKKSVKYE